MWVSKLTLRLISMIFSIVIIGLGASVFSDLNAVNNYYSDWYLDDGYGLVYTGPILFLGPPVCEASLFFELTRCSIMFLPADFALGGRGFHLELG